MKILSIEQFGIYGQSVDFQFFFFHSKPEYLAFLTNNNFGIMESVGAKGYGRYTS